MLHTDSTVAFHRRSSNDTWAIELHCYSGSQLLGFDAQGGQGKALFQKGHGLGQEVSHRHRRLITESELGTVTARTRRRR